VDVTEQLLDLAKRLRDQVPELVDEARVTQVVDTLDRLLAQGRAFVDGFEALLEAEPDLNDWLSQHLDTSPEVYRTFKDLPGVMRLISSGVVVRCPNGHTWELPDAAAWLPPCPHPGCGEALARV
jgi:hypothetical protein